MSRMISEQVRAFQSKFGVNMPDRPTVPEAKTVDLRLGLTGEEFVELLIASGCPDEECRAVSNAIRRAIDRRDHDCFDLVEVADALGDSDYVGEGFRLVCGIDGAPVADEIQRSNLDKMGPDGKPIYRESDGKILKPPGWTPPRIADVLIAQGWNPGGEP
jgi:predicted HAD superfamily Cof-like phosphohydrolase